MLFFTLYGGATATALLLCVYLLQSKVNIIAPGVTPPARLRRWAVAFFGVVALGHGYWLLEYACGYDKHTLLYELLSVFDAVTLLITLFGLMLSMLQDRRRPLRPFAAATLPIVVLGALQIARPDVDFLSVMVAYALSLYTLFTIYMTFAVRQYQKWLRDHYADLEHKEVWASHTLLIMMLLCLLNYGFADDSPSFLLIRMSDFGLFALLLWRVETLSQLGEVPEQQQADPQEEQARITLPISCRRSATDCSDSGNEAGNEAFSHIGQLLEKECVDTGLYLQQDLSLSQLAAAVGVNRYYLGQYFASQGTTYYTYIHDLRISHFVSLCREAVAARRSFTAQQLALESGFRSYTTFASAFKQRMRQSVASWLSEQKK